MAEQQVLKTTALTSTHIALGAKMVAFAGYNMPVLYNNLIQEHLCVRNGVGVFDVSHMGEFWVTGEKAYDLIEFATSNDVSSLYDGRVQYSCLPNKTGGIVDDLLVYKINEQTYLLVVNASNIDKDYQWLQELNLNFGATITNRSEEYSLLAVQGPKALEMLQKSTAINLKEIPYYHFVIGSFAGIENVIISNTGYTGAGGFELYVKNEDAQKVWNNLFEIGVEYNIQPIGLGARDTLRLEKGFCLYGNDIDDTTSPIEAGLGWITKFNHDFVNIAYHKAIKENKPTKRLVGFKMIDKGIPRQHYEIKDAGGNNIGEVTSGTMSPSLNLGIGMGYVGSEFSGIGNEIYIDIRGKLLKAEVSKMPFL